MYASTVLRRLFQPKPKVMPTAIRSEADFQAQVLEAPLPVILDVWSATCAPCRQLEPLLVKVATKYAGRIRVAELAVAAAPQVVARLGVQATPMLIVFDAGKELGRSAGFRPLEWFDGLIETEFPVSSAER